MTPQETKLYEELKLVGSEIESGSINKLESPFIDTIVATLDYFNVSKTHKNHAKYVLSKERMKVVDYLGLALSGRLDIPNDESSNFNLKQIIITMSKLYILQKNVGGFAWWLRGHDLDIEEPSKCEDCIESYSNWHEEQMEMKN